MVLSAATSEPPPALGPSLQLSLLVLRLPLDLFSVMGKTARVRLLGQYRPRYVGAAVLCD